MRRCIRERGSTNERGYERGYEREIEIEREREREVERERERERDGSDWVCVCEFYEHLEEP